MVKYKLLWTVWYTNSPEKTASIKGTGEAIASYL